MRLVLWRVAGLLDSRRQTAYPRTYFWSKRTRESSTGMVMSSRHLLFETFAASTFLLAVLLLSGCNLGDPLADQPVLQPDRPGLGKDMSSTLDMASPQDMSTTLDMSQDMPPVDMVDGAPDMPLADMDACGGSCADNEVCHMDACCAPQTCEALGCGTHETCGQALDCGPCACSQDNFQADCPSRPCERVVGCEPDGAGCIYEPVLCDRMACTCIDPMGCTEDELRRCFDENNGLTCPAIACDPSPMMGSGGEPLFANVCVQPERASCDTGDVCVGSAECQLDTCVPTGCGTCQLGRWECNGDMSGAECDEIDFSILGLPAIECDDTLATSTFIFVDPDVGDDVLAQGSREVPFATLEAAMARAVMRPPAVIIVGRTPGIVGPLTLVDGVSIIGGFGGAPGWIRNPDLSPVIQVSNVPTDEDSVGVVARNITSPTIFRGFSIDVARATDGRSAYGMIVEDSPKLYLSDLSINVGAGGDGFVGRVGLQGADGDVGVDAGTPAGAPPTENSACPAANGGGGGNGRVCVNNSVAQEGSPGFDSPAGVSGGSYGGNGAGNPGDGASGTEPAGADGVPQNLQFEVSNGKWAPVYDIQAADGADGEHGRGGGGGSGSGCAPLFQGASIGGGGGAGASGGCGGSGGGGGRHGGGSFGLFLINSTGLQLSALTISTGAGGAGGAGASGTDGGLGGARGSFPGPPQGQFAGQGGAGGRASNGGAGGHGAGGPGGPSIGVYCHQSDVPLDSESQVTVGPSGLGGPSAGAEGLRGLSTEAYLCPSR